MFGPYIFEGPVNQGIGWCRSRGVRDYMGQVRFQTVASAHYDVTVREFLNEEFRDNWISSGWPASQPDVIL